MRILGHVRVSPATVEAADEFRAGDTVEGMVHLTTTIAFAQRQIGPCLSAFLDAWPEVAIQIVPGEHVVDLVEDG